MRMFILLLQFSSWFNENTHSRKFWVSNTKCLYLHLLSIWNMKHGTNAIIQSTMTPEPAQETFFSVLWLVATIIPQMLFCVQEVLLSVVLSDLLEWSQATVGSRDTTSGPDTRTIKTETNCRAELVLRGIHSFSLEWGLVPPGWFSFVLEARDSNHTNHLIGPNNGLMPRHQRMIKVFPVDEIIWDSNCLIGCWC